VADVNWNPFLTCAVTGAADSTSRNSSVPVTPKEIAEDALAAADAGAAVVHLHVREVDSGAGSRDVSLYQEVLARIRDKNQEVVLNLTGGMGGALQVQAGDAAAIPGEFSDLIGALERLTHAKDGRPDICTVDCGSMNYGIGDIIYVAPMTYLKEMAQHLKEVGVKPEFEVFDLAHISNVEYLIDEGLVEGRPLMQICLGVPGGAPADPLFFQTMAARMPDGAVWSGFGTGRSQMPMLSMAMVLGGNLRVGLEDNIWLSKGVPATNVDLVRRAATIVESLGGTLATPSEVRDRLGLAPSNTARL
jgi:uncharacterized protein (DUF849 family)